MRIFDVRAVLAEFIGGDFEYYFVRSNCFAESLRRDRVSAADIDFFFLPSGTVLFTRVKSTQKARLREGAYTPPLP